MVENKDLKKVRLLYVVVFGLIILVLGIFFYFNNKIENLQKHAESNSILSVNLLKRINKIVELNHLDTENYKYLINPSNWEEILKKETGMTLSDLNNYKIDKVIVRESTDKESNVDHEFEITIKFLNNSPFNEFTSLIYQKMINIFEETNNDTSKVESFKEGKGYYDINSFDEATYNNMYYDYMLTREDGTTSGPKVKVKILYLEETNQIKMEINKF